MIPEPINPKLNTTNGANMTQIRERVARSTASQAAILSELNRCGGSATVRDLGRRTGRSTRSIGVLLYGMQNRGEITTSNNGKERIVALPARKSAALDLPVSAAPAALGVPYWTSVDNAVSFLCGAVLSTNPTVSDTIRRAAKMIRDDRATLVLEIARLSAANAEPEPAAVEPECPAKKRRIRADEAYTRVLAALSFAGVPLSCLEIARSCELSDKATNAWLSKMLKAGILMISERRSHASLYTVRA
jgi:predicted transcriptional regulator